MEGEAFLILYINIIDTAGEISKLAVQKGDLQQRAALLVQQRANLELYEKELKGAELTAEVREEITRNVDVCADSFSFQWENMPWKDLPTH